MGFNQALQNIKKNGGTILDKAITIKPQKPVAVKFEKGFINHYPAEILHIEKDHRKLYEDNPSYSFEFEGVGFIVKGKSEVNLDSNPDIDYNPAKSASIWKSISSECGLFSQ
ncbi:hypothetical protein ES708_17993 [subsurface metagenome]